MWLLGFLSLAFCFSGGRSGTCPTSLFQLLVLEVHVSGLCRGCSWSLSCSLFSAGALGHFGLSGHPKGGGELIILLCVPGRQNRCNPNSYTACPLSPLPCPHIKVSSEDGHLGSHTRINYYTIPPVQIYLSKPQMTQICFKVTTLQIKVMLRHVCGYWRSSFTDRRWNVNPFL